MDAANAAARIRAAMSAVAALRERSRTAPGHAAAVAEIKRLQARRFAATYADLLRAPAFEAPSRFFLEELYGDGDYAERDAQFARIAGTLQKVFPEPVVATAVALAELHAQTEQLDDAMGTAWLDTSASHGPARRYLDAWRTVGQEPERRAQLRVVLLIGGDLARLTRTPGLRLLLKMMRGPATASGMGALQRFLEAGFDTFGGLARRRGAVEQFLGTIEARESELIDLLFRGEAVACETVLQQALGEAP